MPDIHDLLERTTPRRPPTFDVADLVQRGRRRRRRAQVGASLGGVAVAVAVVAGLGLAARGQEGQGLVVASRPPTGELAHAFAATEERVGTWEQVVDPPFSPRMNSFTGTASDGRVVVWGGAPDAETGQVLTDGGIYDPEAESWTAIPPAPLPSDVQLEPIRNRTQLAGDRLMVLASPDEGSGSSRLVGAVYDLVSGEWTVIDPPPTIDGFAEGIAWTGEVLAVVRFWSGATVDTVAAYTAPVVERWSYETGEWETGTTPPLSNRFGPAVSFDGERLGVWGGARQDVALGVQATGAEIVGDGAMYDVAADRWEPIAPGPLQPTMQAAAMWLEARFAVAGGAIEDRSNPPVMASEITGPIAAVYDVAIYDPDDMAWTAVPDAPNTSEGDDRIQPGTHIFDVPEHGGQAPLVSDGPLRSGPHPVLFYDEVTRSWLEAPLRDLHMIGGTLVATSRTPDNPGGEPFEVQVLAGSLWEPATEAPFTNRMDAGVAVVGEELLVVGGAEGPELKITGDAWLLRFDVDPGG